MMGWARVVEISRLARRCVANGHGDLFRRVFVDGESPAPGGAALPSVERAHAARALTNAELEAAERKAKR